MVYCCSQHHHQLDVEMNRLCSHHHEGNQKEIVQQSSHSSTQTGNGRTVDGHDEGQVQAQQSKAEVEQQLAMV